MLIATTSMPEKKKFRVQLHLKPHLHIVSAVAVILTFDLAKNFITVPTQCAILLNNNINSVFGLKCRIFFSIYTEIYHAHGFEQPAPV